MDMSKEQFEEDIVPILVLTIVVCIAVITLSFINSITEGPIENAEKEKIQKLLEEQFPELDTYNEDTPSKDVFTVTNETGAIVGYAFIVEAQGYSSDPIKLLVALENTTLAEDDIILRGISVISNTETPGLGAKITEEKFLAPFRGINLNDVQLRADGGSIDAISGATISSSAVVEAIQKETGLKVKAILEEKAGGE
jgi:electron transport complex protein RnfG